ncbi:hypothetical protein [Pseudomonas fluorescens]|uniref:Uncharacterized protein n=1 Tax=Pseudomonas fluorescens TaxID=294 RepID=A0A5E6XS00_PSEFL|nr:hypothetical protein [Pseudomonas fluorescens]VVN43980.1 hypothetical protein PS655_05648 [Pseudomonas fluorescens]
MQDFSLEKAADLIHYGKSKDYFREVLSSYYNGNYRSAVVMLWSVAVCDVVYKLQSLIDLYEDASAKKILGDMSEIQRADSKSSAWELQLIDDVYSKTNLIDTAEYENLRYLQKQRHLSAHPILNGERELHSPQKDTVRSLLRCVLEGLLNKSPFYTQHIMGELLADIAESKLVLNSPLKVKRYVESRYLERTTVPVERSLFRSLWKIVFKVENEDCDKNRLINLQALEVIATRNKGSIADWVRGDVDYFSNVASGGQPLDFLIYFLSRNAEIFPLLNAAARMKVEHCVTESDVGKTVGWFVKADLMQHGQDIEAWIKTEDPVFSPKQLDALLGLSDSDEWQERFCNILSTYYASSSGYDQADSRFQVAIPQYIELFNEAALHDLALKVESNSQCYDRNRARHDYVVIKARIDSLLGSKFDYSTYQWFSRKLGMSN